MFLLNKIANDEQAKEFLVPVIDGQAALGVRDDRAGRRRLRPRPAADRGGVRRHRLRDQRAKWLITGANGAKTWIIMARVAPNSSRPGRADAVPVDGHTPGIEIERVMNSMDRNYVEGHGVVRFSDLRLPASAVLGEVGQALRYAQLRLAPARLTHCMRWLGAAARAQSIAIEHARTRTAFGKPLGEHQGVELHDRRQRDRAAAVPAVDLVDRAGCSTAAPRAGTRARWSKAFVSEELFKVADRCVQILGGIGVTDETPVEHDLLAICGPFRLYDGPTEVHKYAIARQVLRSPEGNPS